jgi:hypothetical protein
VYVHTVDGHNPLFIAVNIGSDAKHGETEPSHCF